MNPEENPVRTPAEHLRYLYDTNRRLQDELSRVRAFMSAKNDALRLAADYVKLSSDVRESGLGRFVWLKLMDAMLDGPPVNVVHEIEADWRMPPARVAAVG